MSQTDERTRSVAHATFVIERTYAVQPQRVFDAWADSAAKTQWFGPPNKPEGSYSLDFKVGGREHFKMTAPTGQVYTYDALYQDVIHGERIIYTYEMACDGERISVSVATVEIAPDPDGTRLTLTEQGVFLDGLDTVAAREHGTNALMDTLGKLVEGSA